MYLLLIINENKSHYVYIKDFDRFMFHKTKKKKKKYFCKSLLFFADFECKIISAENYEGSCSKKYQDHIPCSLLTNVFVLMINLVSQLFFTEMKMLLINLLKQF